MEDVTAHAEVLLEQILQEQTAIPTTRLLLFDASDSRLTGDDVRNKEAIGDEVHSVDVACKALASQINCLTDEA